MKDREDKGDKVHPRSMTPKGDIKICICTASAPQRTEAEVHKRKEAKTKKNHPRSMEDKGSKGESRG